MTKKHYEAIALRFLRFLHTNTTNTKPNEWLAKELADYFASDNPRFNRERFLQACGIEQEEQEQHDKCQECGKDLPEYWQMPCIHCGK